MISPAPHTAKSASAQSSGRTTVLISLIAAVGIALLALVGGALYSTAFGPQDLLDPGPIVRWGLATSIVLTELFLAVTVGSLVLAVFVVPGAGKAPKPRPPRTKSFADMTQAEIEKAQAAARTGAKNSKKRAKAPKKPSVTFTNAMLIAALGASGWALASLARLLFTGANMIGVPLSDPTFGEQWITYVTKIPSGRVLLALTVVAALVSLLTFAVRGPVGAMWTLALTCVAFALLASMGHSAGGANHTQAVSGMAMHLVGAAVWIGALVAIALLYLMPSTPAKDLPATVSRYSTIAGWCYILVAVSGLVSAIIRVGGFSGLSTKYGVLVLTKVAIFAFLGVFGWLHRRHVVRVLDGAQAARDAAQQAATTVVPAVFWRLAAVEIMVMGAVSGVAVALGGTNPPESDATPADPSPAYIVMGRDLPPEPSVARWFTEWNVEVLLAFLCAAGLFVYWRWVLRLRARGDSWSWLRTASWTFAMIILFWVTSGGPAVYGAVLFSSHMLMHMALAMVIPIFLTSAAPVTLMMRAVPARKDSSRGPREWLLGIIHSRYGQFFSHPIVAAVNFAGSMIVFYYTPAFELAMSTHLGHLAMIIHFSLVGYFFTNALIGIDPGPNRPGYAQRLVLLLATMAFHAFFGVTLMGSNILLAPDWFGLMGRTWGDSAIVDQQRGGGIAWGIGEIPTIILALIVAVTWSQSDERAAKRRDRQVDTYGDSELDAYNAMLADMTAKETQRKESQLD